MHLPGIAGVLRIRPTDWALRAIVVPIALTLVVVMEIYWLRRAGWNGTRAVQPSARNIVRLVHQRLALPQRRPAVCLPLKAAVSWGGARIAGGSTSHGFDVI
jgi:hypothetical protein